MFVFLMITVGLVCWVVSAIITNRDERRHRNRAIKNGYDSYTDRNGILRRVDTNEPYWLWRDLNGDVWEINPYTRKILKNVSNEVKQKKWKYERNLAIRECRKVFQIEGLDEYRRGRGRYLYSSLEMQGCHYMDTDNGALYVKREMFGKPWYIGVESQKVEFCDTSEMEMYYKNAVACQFTTESYLGIERWNQTIVGSGFLYFLPNDTVFNYVDILKEDGSISKTGRCVWCMKPDCSVNIMEVRHRSFSYVMSESGGVPKYKTIDGYYVVASEIINDWIETEKNLLNNQISDYIYNINTGCDGGVALRSYDVYLNQYYHLNNKHNTDRKYIIGQTKTDSFRQGYIEKHSVKGN